MLLLDPGGGPAAIADGLAGAAAELRCDAILLLDVGGDVLAHGDEAGLASPLADAVCLACAPRLEAVGMTTLLAVFGAGCDGELTPAEVLERVDEVAGAGGSHGSFSPPAASLARLQAAVAEIPTEASAMAVRCARGETGTTTIRGGRRTVELTAAGGRIFFLDAVVALRSAARGAALVEHAGSLDDANDVLLARGIPTELAYETEHAAGR